MIIVCIMYCSPAGVLSPTEVLTGSDAAWEDDCPIPASHFVLPSPHQLLIMSKLLVSTNTFLQSVPPLSQCIKLRGNGNGMLENVVTIVLLYHIFCAPSSHHVVWVSECPDLNLSSHLSPHNISHRSVSLTPVSLGKLWQNTNHTTSQDIPSLNIIASHKSYKNMVNTFLFYIKVCAVACKQRLSNFWRQQRKNFCC